MEGKMKLLTITIPSYNSEAYMRNCIESLLPGGEDVEILVVDDGSGDRTGEIADEYEKRYPGIVRAIHQENGGHGAAVNTGLEHASGLYFKVVDSDDWVKESVYRTILQTLRELAGGSTAPDMPISNFVLKITECIRIYCPLRKCFTSSHVKIRSFGSAWWYLITLFFFAPSFS